MFHMCPHDRFLPFSYGFLVWQCLYKSNILKMTLNTRWFMITSLGFMNQHWNNNIYCHSWRDHIKALWCGSVKWNSPEMKLCVCSKRAVSTQQPKCSHVGDLKDRKGFSCYSCSTCSPLTLNISTHQTFHFYSQKNWSIWSDWCRPQGHSRYWLNIFIWNQRYILNQKLM